MIEGNINFTCDSHASSSILNVVLSSKNDSGKEKECNTICEYTPDCHYFKNKNNKCILYKQGGSNNTNCKVISELVDMSNSDMRKVCLRKKKIKAGTKDQYVSDHEKIKECMLEHINDIRNKLFIRYISRYNCAKGGILRVPEDLNKCTEQVEAADNNPHSNDVKNIQQIEDLSLLIISNGHFKDEGISGIYTLDHVDKDDSNIYTLTWKNKENHTYLVIDKITGNNSTIVNRTAATTYKIIRGNQEIVKNATPYIKDAPDFQLLTEVWGSSTQSKGKSWEKLNNGVYLKSGGTDYDINIWTPPWTSTTRNIKGFHVAPIHPIETLINILTLVKKVNKSEKNYGINGSSSSNHGVLNAYMYSGILYNVYNSYKEILEYRNKRLSYIKNCISSGDRKQDCDVLGI